jgi:hypothetical protein
VSERPFGPRAMGNTGLSASSPLRAGGEGASAAVSEEWSKRGPSLVADGGFDLRQQLGWENG